MSDTSSNSGSSGTSGSSGNSDTSDSNGRPAQEVRVRHVVIAAYAQVRGWDVLQ